MTGHFNFMDLNTDNPKYKYLACEKAKSPCHSGLVEKMLKHLTGDKHKSQIQDNELNDRLLTAINKTKYVEESPAAEIGSTNNGIQNKFMSRILLIFYFSLRSPNSWWINIFYSLLRRNQYFFIYKVSRDTITRIVNYCICGSLKQKIIEDLNRTPCSLAINETTILAAL